jgi:multiple sugar transport system substrate-binding protein
MMAQRPGLIHDQSPLGPDRLSRKRLLGLGAAAGLAGAISPLDRAHAAWAGSTSRDLSGTVSFCAFLYEVGTNAGAGTESVPARVYKKYTDMHPGVKLAFIPEPTTDWNAWFLTRTLAGREPDLVEGSPASAWAWIRKGDMVPITKYLLEPNPYIPGNKRWLDSFPTGYLKPLVGLDGEYYGISADTSAIWVYYNPEHLDAIGMKAPATWAEMIEACARLKGKGITPYSQIGGLGWPISWWFLFAESSLWASEFPPGTSLDMPSWVRAVKKGLLKKTDARTRQAWQLVKQFGTYWQQGAVHGAPNVYKDFANRKVTFMQDGSWNINFFTTMLKGKFPLTVVPDGIPPMTTQTSRYADGSLQDSGCAALNGAALFVTQHAKDHLDLVIDFARYYSSPQAIGPMARETGNPPMIKGVGTLPPLMEQARRVALQPGLLMISYYNADPTIITTYDKMAQGYLAGAVSLDAALSTLQGLQDSFADKLAAMMHL